MAFLFIFMFYGSTYKKYVGIIEKQKCVKNYDNTYHCIVQVKWLYSQTKQPIKQNKVVDYVFDNKVHEGDRIIKTIERFSPPCKRCIKVKYWLY